MSWFWRNFASDWFQTSIRIPEFERNDLALKIGWRTASAINYIITNMRLFGGVFMSPAGRAKITEGTLEDSFYPSSHNHGSVENGCISNISFLSFRVIFHIHEYGRKNKDLLCGGVFFSGSGTQSVWINSMQGLEPCTVHPLCIHCFQIQELWLMSEISHRQNFFKRH